MCVVTGRGVVFNVRSVDGDTTSFFFRRVIDLVECASSTAVGFSQYGSDCSGQRCLPWSTWPIVPTLTCGFVRSNF
ncbi:hypothetical protein SB359474_3056, partial [Shigella boydii 3594-74]